VNKALYTTVLLLSLSLYPPALFAHQDQEEKELSEEILQFAHQGDPEAQFSIGIRYDLGYGVERNPEEAAQWFQKAAEQGIIGAYIYLGIKYEFGSGLAQDQAAAKDWYRRAALHGWPQGAYLLGNAHLHNPPPDRIQGCAWLALAAEEEYLGAQEALEEYCTNVSSTEQEAITRIRDAVAEQMAAAKQNNL
jgi:TPR repeat protein